MKTYLIEGKFDGPNTEDSFNDSFRCMNDQKAKSKFKKRIRKGWNGKQIQYAILSRDIAEWTELKGFLEIS